MNRFAAFAIVAVFSVMPFAIEGLYRIGTIWSHIAVGVLIPAYVFLFLTMCGVTWISSHVKGEQ